MVNAANTTRSVRVSPWLGEEKRLQPATIERINAIPHKEYVEPFVGFVAVVCGGQREFSYGMEMLRGVARYGERCPTFHRPANFHL